MNKIVVLIPTRQTELDLALKAAQIQKERAGIHCEVKILVDSEQKGWVHSINRGFEENPGYDYYVYSCTDYFPGRRWLQIGMQTLIKDKKGLLAFNDGKWFGRIATAGIVSKEFIAKTYKDKLLPDCYKNHYADTEISIVAEEMNELCYNPNAVLVEVDYDGKDTRPVNVKDRNLFNERLKTGFGLINPKSLDRHNQPMGENQ